MAWREEFTQEDINKLLAAAGLNGWESDWDAAGNLEFSPPNGTCSAAEFNQLLEAFKPVHATITACFDDLPATKAVLRIDLAWPAQAGNVEHASQR